MLFKTAFDIVFAISLAIGTWARGVSLQFLLQSRGITAAFSAICMYALWPVVELFWKLSISLQLQVQFPTAPPARMNSARLIRSFTNIILTFFVIPAWFASAFFVWWPLFGHDSPGHLVQAAVRSMIHSGRVVPSQVHHIFSLLCPPELDLVVQSHWDSIAFPALHSFVESMQHEIASAALICLLWVIGTHVIQVMHLIGVWDMDNVVYHRDMTSQTLVAALLTGAVIGATFLHGFAVSTPPASINAPADSHAVMETWPNSTDAVPLEGVVESNDSIPVANVSAAIAVAHDASLVPSTPGALAQLGQTTFVSVAHFEGINTSAWNASDFALGSDATLRLGFNAFAIFVVLSTICAMIAVGGYTAYSYLSALHDELFDKLYLTGRNVKEMPDPARRRLRKRMKKSKNRGNHQFGQ